MDNFLQELTRFRHFFRFDTYHNLSLIFLGSFNKYVVKDVNTMKISPKVWKNGEFVEWDEARVHVMSHVIHYGSSVFEGIRCYNTTQGSAVFGLPNTCSG